MLAAVNVAPWPGLAGAASGLTFACQRLRCVGSGIQTFACEVVRRARCPDRLCNMSSAATTLPLG
eukprot:1854573-Pyramimonas_sp.AAC.1